MSLGNPKAVSEEGDLLVDLAGGGGSGQGGDEEGRLFCGLDLGMHLSGLLTPTQGLRDGLAPSAVNLRKALAESLVEGRHFHREVADRAAVEDEAFLGVLILDRLQEAPQDALQDGNGVVRFSKRLHPPVMHGGGEELFQHRIAHFIFPEK